MKNDRPLKELMLLKEILHYYKEEIADLLMKLSHLLDASNNKSILSQAEYFFKELLQCDTATDKMKKEALDIQQLLEHEDSLIPLHNFSKKVRQSGKYLADLRTQFLNTFPLSGYDQKAA